MADRERTAAGQGMPCPACQVDLVMSERQGIEIDYCPKCRGVWLDRGELDKIIERSASEDARAAPAAPVSPPQQAHQPQPPAYGQQQYPPRGYEQGHRGDAYRGHDPYGHGHKRKKSFLEDLFD